MCPEETIMQEDFHYYATYAAANLAGYTPEESREIAYSAQFVDLCTESLLEKLNGPVQAATTQSQLELADTRTDIPGLQNITRIWASFHFLPGNLYAQKAKRGRLYMNKYRLICNPDSDLVVETVELARGKSLQAVGLAMHVLADTWAHRYFAGTPSFVINNATGFSEIRNDSGWGIEKKIVFNHNPATSDNLETGSYTSTLYQMEENSIMNLGHGRAGHLPDYSFMRYKFMPAWGDYEMVFKDNPYEYWHAFCQMVYAMRYLRGERDRFEKKRYEEDSLDNWKKDIMEILAKRQRLSSDDWKAFGLKISGHALEDFDIEKYQAEYVEADQDGRYDTFLGKFFIAALAQKSMVTNRIFMSGNLTAGFSIDYQRFGFKGIRDYRRLVEARKRGERNG